MYIKITGLIFRPGDFLIKYEKERYEQGPVIWPVPVSRIKGLKGIWLRPDTQARKQAEAFADPFPFVRW